jgi:mRNA-degrading endonuclease RelE of RelBE toxin-antitoxin system
MSEWKVMLTSKCAKQLKKLPENVNLITQLLIEDLKEKGPYPGVHWPNYSKLFGGKQEDKRHCHLVKGRPTYVACWNVLDKHHLIEVYYVGTHEKAPY